MLTKSKLLAWRQCPKRLWLETHGAPQQDTARKSRGREIGELARSLLGAPGAELIERGAYGAADARARTSDLIASGRGVFEAAFGDDELSAYVDIVRPALAGWELLEVKDSGSVKPHHCDDAAIQWAAAARGATAPERVIIAHVDTGWTYPGGGDYRGLFKEADVTEETRDLVAEVDGWIAGAMAMLQAERPPQRETARIALIPILVHFTQAVSLESRSLCVPLGGCQAL